jgi:hypothetical protein
MKQNRILTGIVVLGMAVLTLSSCGKMPQEKVDAANTAVQAAIAAGADTYVAAEFNALQDSMKSVMADAEAENSKFFKNFDGVSAKLDAVAALATTVAGQAEARKEAIKVEVATILTDITAIVAENTQLIADAPKGKEGATALSAIATEVETITASAAEVSTLLNNGELLPALEKANAAKAKAMSINAELKAVIEKFAAGKKK